MAHFAKLNKNTCLWEEPIFYFEDGEIYFWDESEGTWIEKYIN